MVTTRQLSFAGGEIAPSLYGRIDTVKYATGLKKCRNFTVLRHGGIANRPGTQFIAEVKDSSKATRIIPFVFNDDQTYILEFGDQYIRFIRNGIQLGAPYEISTPYLEAELFELQYVQSADVITITHPNHAPQDLTRTGHTSWTLTPITFAPTQGPPTGVGVAGSGAGANYIYHVTAVDTETGEESLAATGTGVNIRAPHLGPHTITWTAPAGGADEYMVYLEVNGVPGFVGVARGLQFVNDGITPDIIDTPPTARNPFSGAGNFPSTVTYYQQRLVFGGTDNNPETVWASRTGLRTNFTTSSPLQDDDAVTFTLSGREVHRIRHLVEIGTLVVLTTGGEWAIRGDQAGVLKTADVNPKLHSYNGSATLPPIVVDDVALHVQARGSVVRDLGFDLEVDGYRGNDLTIFSAHLFDQFTLSDWALQQIPHSIVWVVRDDGTLLGLTYVREHELIGWHRHDTLGTFESVAVVPEGNEDRPYVVVRRFIDGSYVRYIERMETRQVDEDAIEDSVFVDSFLSYDGRNASATTMTLSGGPPWVKLTALTLTASAGAFVAGDVGNSIHMNSTDGRPLRCNIIAFTSSTVVTVRPHRDVPTDLQAAATTSWSLAKDTFADLSHLEGEDVAVFADGFVVANPNNASHVVRTVASGEVTLERPYAVVHIGLPYLSDAETLNIDTLQGETLADKKKLVTNVYALLESSRGLWAGIEPPSDDSVDPLENLRELKVRRREAYDKPVRLVTEYRDVNVKSRWNKNGSAFLRQVDPVPITILAIAASGLMPFQG